jgi:hypothetical protein
MFSNISSLVGAKWYLGNSLSGIYHYYFGTNDCFGILTGVPMNDTANPRLQIAEAGEAILGDNLLGLQVGNEPDLYGAYVYHSSILPSFPSLSIAELTIPPPSLSPATA